MNMLKSRTIRFNLFMAVIDVAVTNAALMAELIPVKDFAITMIVLKMIQSIGNIYYRSITTEPLDAK